MLSNLEISGVSVVICSFNGQLRLPQTLSHLRRQENPTVPWEVVLVDNDSTDDTVRVAKEMWNQRDKPCELRIVSEKRKGTMFARRTGIERASFRYLLYCDDDNWLAPDFVKQAYLLISANQNIAAVGALGKMVFDSGFVAPKWAVKFGSSYGAGPQGKGDGDTTYSKGCLYTAGAIIDRVWLNRLYSSGFRSSLKGRDGKSLVAGEDTELTYALKLIGGKLYYSSKMEFRHFMPAHRLTWEYVKKLWYAAGYADFLISPYKMQMGKIKWKSATRKALEQLLLAMKYGVRSLFAGEGSENVLRFNRALGEISAALRGRKTFRENSAMVKSLVKNQPR